MSWSPVAAGWPWPGVGPVPCGLFGWLPPGRERRCSWELPFDLTWNSCRKLALLGRTVGFAWRMSALGEGTLQARETACSECMRGDPPGGQYAHTCPWRRQVLHGLYGVGAGPWASCVSHTCVLRHLLGCACAFGMGVRGLFWRFWGFWRCTRGDPPLGSVLTMCRTDVFWRRKCAAPPRSAQE